MIRMIIMFVVLLASVYMGLWLQHDPGYVVITIHHWTIESTFWVAIIAMICFAVLVHFLLFTFKCIADLPHRWCKWRANRRLNKAQAKTKRGLIEFSEGYWKTAKKHLISAATDTDLPLINYLTAARAAEELGEPVLRDQYLYQAQEVAPDATIAIELIQAQLQLDHQEWEKAAATLQALQSMSPDHPYVLKLLLHLYRSTQNGSALIQLLPKLKSNHILSERDLHQIKQQAYLQIIQTYIEDESESIDHTPLEALRETGARDRQILLNGQKTLEHFMRDLPKDLKHDIAITVLYSRYLLSRHRDKTAEHILRDCLQHNLDEQLLQWYGQINPTEARLPFIESLLKKHPRSAAVHRCLGELLAAKQVWGSAKTHLEQSIQIQPSFEAYYALGKLFEVLEDQTAACSAYRQASECILANYSLTGSFSPP